MKKIAIVLLMSVSVVAFGQEEDVKAAFSKYKEAMLAQDVDGVLASTAKNSTEYYAELIDNALHADSAKVASLPLIDKLSVLGTRIQISREELMDMDGEGYIRYGLENNMNNAQALQMMDIGKVTMAGDNKAQAQIMLNGQVMPASMDFIKESDGWKFDAVSLIKMSEGMLQQTISMTGMSENDFIMRTLEQVNGSPVSNDIWQPLDK